jgi:hypothetical protein
MEKIKLLVKHHKHKGYDAITHENAESPLLINETKENGFIVKRNGSDHNYKCQCKTSDGGSFVIKNLKKNVDISKYHDDGLLICRYFIEKNNVSYIRSKEHKIGKDRIEYELVIVLNDGKIIKANFDAKEAVETYEFLRRCFKLWNNTKLL